MISIKEKRIQEAGTPALLCFKPEERPADCRITSVINVIYRGTGNTCIFSHNSHLSQCVLGGKHPSSTYHINLNPFINFLLENYAAEEKIRVRARPPFLHLRPGLKGLNINRSRRIPFTAVIMLRLCKKFSVGIGTQSRSGISEQNCFGIGSLFSELGKRLLMIGLGKEAGNCWI